MNRMTVLEAIGALEQTLPSHVPELWESLQPSVSPDDLEFLRDAVAPLGLPSGLIELLGRRNGGSWGGPWWPIIDCGHLFDAAEADEHYRALCEITEEWQWTRSWLPIAYEEWYQCGLELGSEHHATTSTARSRTCSTQSSS